MLKTLLKDCTIIVDLERLHRAVEEQEEATPDGMTEAERLSPPIVLEVRDDRNFQTHRFILAPIQPTAGPPGESLPVRLQLVE